MNENSNSNNVVPEFEEFRGSGSRYETYYVGITASGVLSIYAGFYQQEGIKNYSRALLLYDPQQKLIGLKFIPESEAESTGKKGTANINHADDKNNAWISATNFFKHYQLKPEQFKGKYSPTSYDTEKWGKVYFIDLKNPAKNTG